MTAPSARTAAEALIRWVLDFQCREVNGWPPLTFLRGLAQAAELVRKPAAIRTIKVSMCSLVRGVQAALTRERIAVNHQFVVIVDMEKPAVADVIGHPD